MGGLRSLITHTRNFSSTLPTSMSRRCSRTTLTQHTLGSSLTMVDEIHTLVHLGPLPPPHLSHDPTTSRWMPMHIWLGPPAFFLDSIMGIGRPRDDSVVSCDLYTLAVAPFWLLRHFFLLMAGGGNTWSFGFFLCKQSSFCWSGLLVFLSLFLGGFFPAISLGIWLIPPSQQISVWFSLAAEDHLVLFFIS